MRNSGKSALIAGESLTVRARIARVLQSEGFSVELASNWRGGISVASKQRFDIAIVVPSRTLPLIMAEELLQKLPKLLILTDEPAEIGGLESLSRPVRVLPISASNEDLLDQLNKMLQTTETTGPSSTLLLGNCRIDFASQSFVDASGRETRLTTAEAALLKDLAQEVGQTRSRDELRQAVAGRGADRFDRSIDMLVARLRNKIEPDPKTPQFLLTVPRIGYKLFIQPNGAVNTALAKEAQRRQLTILSCNIANWSAFAFDLDPEDLSNISRSFRAVTDPVITRMGGTIFSHKADALLAYFCYPQSSEHDADFAVRAALNILQAVDAFRGSTPIEPQVKIGIASGVVVLSGIELIGEPVDSSIRMRDVAPPNALLIDVNTRKLLDSDFTFEAHEPYSLPDVSKRIPCFQVVAEQPREARTTASLTRRALIGRDSEMQQLFRLWERAKRWHGQIAVVSGEPGIGKSRLCETFIDRISNEPHKVLRYQCAPLLRNSPLHPIIAQVEQDFELQKEDTPEIKLKKLQSTLLAGRQSRSVELSLYSELLSLPANDAFQSRANTKQNRDRLIARLARHVVDLAFNEPLVIVITDPHWADSSTLQFIDYFIRSIKAAPVLLLFQCRPEYSPGWLGAPHVNLVNIDRLGRNESLALVSTVPGANLLPTRIKEQIIARSDGVPLFIEEITKSLLEPGMGQKGELSGSKASPIEVPTTLVASLTARLDRVGEAKEIAQIAAAIGPECPYGLLKQVAQLPTKKFDDYLERLVAAKLLSRRDASPNVVYSFSHALLRDATYSTLLKARRIHLHEAIAKALVRQLSEGMQVQAEVIAYHYTESHKPGEALHYWREAAKYAAGRSAHKEAIEHLNEALTQVAHLEDVAARNKAELGLQTMKGNSLRAIEGWTAEGVKAAYSRALQLCNSQTADEDVFGPVFGLWAWHFVRPVLGEARELAERLITIARSTARPAHEILGRQALGFTLFAQGKFEHANTELERSVHLCDDRQAAICLSLSGQDPRVHARLYRALALWFLGCPDRALAVSAEALRRAQLSEDPFSEAMARTIGLRIHQLRGEPAVVTDLADAAIAVSKEYGFVHYLAMGSILRGWSRAMQGEIDSGIVQMNEGLRTERLKGALIYETYALSLLADACIKHQRYEQALGFLRRALQMVTQDHSACFYAAEIYRLMGEAHFGLNGNPTEAERYISKGLKLAREQSAKSVELKLYVTLCEFYPGSREFSSAFRQVIESFEEGHDSSDLIRARAILEDLGIGVIRAKKIGRSQGTLKRGKDRHIARRRSASDGFGAGQTRRPTTLER